MPAITWGEIRIPAGQDLGAAGRLREALLQALADHAGLKVHLEQEPPFDLALAQLLCAAHRSAARSGKALQLAAPWSAAALQALERMGLRGAADCPVGDCLWGSGAP